MRGSAARLRAPAIWGRVERRHTESRGSRRSAVPRTSITTIARPRGCRRRARTPTSLCTEAPPEERVNLPFAEAGQLRQQRAATEPHDGHLFGKRDVRVVPLADVQVAQDHAGLRSLGAHALSTSPAHRKLTCYECHTKQLGEGKPTAACEQCHAKDNPPQGSLRRVRQPAAPARRATRRAAEWRPPRSTTVHRRASRSWPSTPKRRAARVTEVRAPPTSNPSRTSCQGKERRLHGLPSAQERARLQEVHERAVLRRAGRRATSSRATRTSSRPARCRRSISPRPQFGPFPLVKGHKDVPCAECHTGRSKSNKTTFEKIPRVVCPENKKSATRTRCTRARSPPPVRSCATRPVRGTRRASTTTSRSPTTRRARSRSSRSRARTRRTSASRLPPDDRKFAETNTRRARPRAVTQDDDAHKGRLGNKCEQCHVETGDNTFNHNTMSAFQLDGKHLEVRCADCHPSITFKPRPTDLLRLPPRARRSTRASTARGCEQCHSTRDVGGHQAAARRRRLLAQGHARQHRVRALPHATTARSPAPATSASTATARTTSTATRCRRAAASATRSGRSRRRGSITRRVGCNLTGLHRTIACFDCHKNGNFSGAVGRSA